MPDTNQAATGFDLEDPKKLDAPKAYLNLAIIDKNGTEHKIKTGIPIGGKHEKGISEAMLTKLDEEGYEFKLVGRLNSAVVQKADIAL